MGQSASANVPRAGCARFLFLYFAETDCPTLTLRKGDASSAPLAAQDRGGGIRFSEIKEEGADDQSARGTFAEAGSPTPGRHHTTGDA